MLSLGAFSALTLLVVQYLRHLACKNWLQLSKKIMFLEDLAHPGVTSENGVLN